MKRSLLKQLLLYRYRYAVAYIIFFALLITLLVMQLPNVPSGLSAAEKESVVASAAVKLTTETSVVDLPYHLLQKASVALLGLNAFAIKLPSLVFGLLSGVGIILLLRRWFSHNVALIAALFIVTNVLFLSAARTGTPAIMLIFFSTYILLFSTLITQGAKGQFAWRILFGGLLAASLYTPLSAYVIASCLAAGLLHPHPRYVLKRYGGRQLVGALFLFVPIAAPLAVGLWKDYTVAFTLLGFPDSLPSAAEFGRSLLETLTRLGGITEPRIGEFVQPAFSIVSLALIGLGMLRAMIDFHATRTYALLIWLAVITPAVIISQSYLPILFVPSALLIAIGLQTLIREWYALFPRNPYARLVGLVPLLVLSVGVISFNYVSYFYGLRYSPETARVYSVDLRLVNEVLRRDDINKADIVVAAQSEDVAFYRLLTRQTPAVRVVDVASYAADGTKGTVIVHGRESVSGDIGALKKLSVSDRREDALRWRTYVRW